MTRAPLARSVRGAGPSAGEVRPMSGPDAHGNECDDYEYDLVHDEIELPGARQPEPRGPVSVDVPSDDVGDYGYDLAHDVS